MNRIVLLAVGLCALGWFVSQLGSSDEETGLSSGAAESRASAGEDEVLALDLPSPATARESIATCSSPPALEEAGSGAGTTRYQRPVSGGSILGSIRDASGRLDRGRAFFFRSSPGGELVRVAHDEIGRDGRFEFHARDWEGTFHVLAVGSSSGSAWVRDLVLSPASMLIELPLVLTGAGVLAGRIVDPLGNPLPHKRLAAVLTILDREPDFDTLAEHTRDDGQISAVALSEADGSFHFAGLRSDEYHILGRNLDSSILVYPGVYSTNDEYLELVDDDQRLVVSVVDRAGERVTARQSGSSTALTEEPSISVYPLQEGAIDLRPVPGRELEDGRFVYSLEPGIEYALRLASLSSIVEERVVLAPRDYIVERELLSGSERPPGALVVRLLDPAGDPLQIVPYWGEPVDHTRVTVEDETGRWIDVDSFQAMDGMREFALPGGRYRIHAELTDVEGTHAGDRLLHRPSQATASIHPGRTTELELRLEPGGRLEILVDEPAPRLNALEAREDPKRLTIELYRLGGASGASERVSGEATFTFQAEPTPDHSGIDLPSFSLVDGSSTIYPSYKALSTSLAPGDYRVVALRSGALAYEGETTIVAGEITFLRLGPSTRTPD